MNLQTIWARQIVDAIERKEAERIEQAIQKRIAMTIMEVESDERKAQ